MTRHIASEKARAHWREILDAVAAGEEIVIERYGRPVAVLAPYPQDLTPGVREPSPIYDSTDLHALKEEIAVDVAAHILAQGVGQAALAHHARAQVGDETPHLVQALARRTA